MADSFKEKFHKCTSKADKMKLAKDLVILWRNQEPRGRFLARSDPSLGDASNWHDVGDVEAVKKSMTMLRKPVFSYQTEVTAETNKVTSSSASSNHSSTDNDSQGRALNSSNNGNVGAAAAAAPAAAERPPQNPTNQALPVVEGADGLLTSAAGMPGFGPDSWQQNSSQQDQVRFVEQLQQQQESVLPVLQQQMQQQQQQIQNDQRKRAAATSQAALITTDVQPQGDTVLSSPQAFSQPQQQQQLHSSSAGRQQQKADQALNPIQQQQPGGRGTGTSAAAAVAASVVMNQDSRSTSQGLSSSEGDEVRAGESLPCAADLTINNPIFGSTTDSSDELDDSWGKPT